MTPPRFGSPQDQAYIKGVPGRNTVLYRALDESSIRSYSVIGGALKQVKEIGPIAAWYGLAVMILVTMAGNAIPQMVALLTEAIKHEFTLSDAQIGAMRGLALTLVVAIASFPVAWLADRIDRRIVFAACMLIWASATIAMGFAQSYPILFALAIGLAFGEAVLGPVTFAVIPDLFPREQRMLANSVFFISQVLGVGVGLTLGGAVLASLPSWQPLLPAPISEFDVWRLAIIASAAPTLALIPLVLLMRLRRRRNERGDAIAPLQAGNMLEFAKLHARTLFPVFIGFSLIGVGNFIPFGWLAVILMRTFGEDPSEVGVRLGQVFSIAGVAGVVVANLAARALARRNPETAPVRVAQIGATLALLFTLGYLFAQSTLQFYVLAGLQIACSSGGLVLSPTMSQNMTPANIRARLIALGGLFYIGFGALSPLLVGAISDALGPDPRSLLYAMAQVTMPAFALGIAALQLSLATLKATLDAARDSN